MKLSPRVVAVLGYVAIVLPVLVVVMLSTVVLTAGAPFWIRLFDLLLSYLTVALVARRYGEISTARRIRRETEWMPKNVHVTRKEDGSAVAFVEQMSGEMVSIDLPEEIDSQQAAMEYILDRLHEGR